MQPTLPADLSDDELARDWMLSHDDLVEVHRCRGDDKRHSFAMQLCMLRRHGVAADDRRKIAEPWSGSEA
jgi:hypothetical protein